jgi:hypothetical protein
MPSPFVFFKCSIQVSDNIMVHLVGENMEFSFVCNDFNVCVND